MTDECAGCHVIMEIRDGLEPSNHGLCHPCASSALDEVLEVLAPFALHANALKVDKRQDIITPISKIGVSSLCVGAFQSALETFKKFNPGWGEDADAAKPADPE